MTAHILLVEDEPAVTAVLDPVLRATGYRVTIVTTGGGALAALIEEPDLVLLDLGLPDMDGKAVIEEMRCRAALPPIIVVSARHREAEKIAALDAGADDYVDKPFEIGELMARIRAAVRRSLPRQERSIYVRGELSIDVTARRIRLGDETVRLSPKEWALLSILVANAGQIVTHRQLLAAGWGHQIADTQYLRVYVGLLRQKLEAHPSDPRIILTEPGLGYRLADPA